MIHADTTRVASNDVRTQLTGHVARLGGIASNSVLNLTAARIARAIAPSTVLEIGPTDALSQQLSKLGIKAQHMALPIDQAGGGEVQPNLSGGHWDVITCLGVLEQLAPDGAEALIERICAATEIVVVSCGAPTYFAPASPSVRPAAAWAAAFAERGFFRRTDLDFEFAGPWTVVFERATPATRELVTRYEQTLTAALIALSERCASDHGGSPGTEPQVDDLQARIVELRHELLVSRDHAMGQEAQMSQLQIEADALRGQLQAVYSSNTWRMGARIGKPVGRVKRALGNS